MDKDSIPSLWSAFSTPLESDNSMKELKHNICLQMEWNGMPRGRHHQSFFHSQVHLTVFLDVTRFLFRSDCFGIQEWLWAPLISIESNLSHSRSRH